MSANCNPRYVYEWDEVGQLARARRWDGEGSDNAQGPPPASKPEVELTYAYDEGGQRTLKTALSDDGTEVHSAYIFGSLELRRALWSLAEGNSDERDYERSVDTQVIQLNAHGTRLGRITYGASDLPSQSSGRRHVFLELVDPLRLHQLGHRPGHGRARRTHHLPSLRRHRQRRPTRPMERLPRGLPIYRQRGGR